MMFSFFPSPRRAVVRPREIHALYIALARRSRNPFFYEEAFVPDTLDGRFDVILLHLYLATAFLERLPDGKARCRMLLERFFDDMDRSLREMGVGDMGVGRRVQAMSEAVYGRLAAYRAAGADEAMLKTALERNLYRGAPPSESAVEAVMLYIKTLRSETLLEEAAYIR